MCGVLNLSGVKLWFRELSDWRDAEVTVLVRQNLAVGTLPGLGGGMLWEGWRSQSAPLVWKGQVWCLDFPVVTFLSECKILII